MDEILASIRLIIAEDPQSQSSQASQKARAASFAVQAAPPQTVEPEEPRRNALSRFHSRTWQRAADADDVLEDLFFPAPADAATSGIEPLEAPTKLEPQAEPATLALDVPTLPPTEPATQPVEETRTAEELWRALADGLAVVDRADSVPPEAAEHAHQETSLSIDTSEAIAAPEVMLAAVDNDPALLSASTVSSVAVAAAAVAEVAAVNAASSLHAATPESGARADAPGGTALTPVSVAHAIEPLETTSAPVVETSAEAHITTAASVESFEETIAGMLRPLLREWLDANMPRMIDKALRSEHPRLQLEADATAPHTSPAHARDAAA